MTKEIIKLSIVGLLAIGFNGCTAQYKTLKIGQIDKTKRTMTLPSVGNAMFEIKSALIKSGWKIKVGNAELEEKGINNKRINTNTKLIFDTEYRLYMTSTMSSNTNHGIVIFNLSVVNNKTNEEVVNMVGNREDYVRYAPQDIAINLVKALK
jgi:hypothetical protein